MDSQYGKLCEELKKFFTLQIDYAKLTAVEKLVIIMSSVAVAFVLAVLGACALFYLSFALVYVIKGWIGCEWGAYLIVGCIFIICVLVVYALKERLIINPVARFITKLFLDKK